MNRPLSSVVLLVALAGCKQPIVPPTAAITPLSEGPFAAGDLVGFDAVASTDANDPPLPLVYHWRIASAPVGSAPELFGAGGAVFSFRADQYGDYVVGLIADDGVVAGPEATVTVTVANCGNEAPVVDGITADPAAPGTDAVIRLSSSVSDVDTGDACGLTQPITYAWALASTPSGSGARLSDPAAREPWFEADVPGDYVVTLIATDATGRASAAGETTITASECGSAAPSVTSVTVSPTDPGASDLVALAIAVHDADADDPCTIAQDVRARSELIAVPSGSAAALTPADGLDASFYPDVPGDYVVRTTATDTTGRSSYLDTPITVSECGFAAPTFLSETVSPTTPHVGDVVAYALTYADADEDSSSCNLDQQVVFSSRIVSQPPGSTASLSPAYGPTPAIVPDLPGAYAIRFTVSDDTGRSSSVTREFTAGACGTASPHIDSLGATPTVAKVGVLSKFAATVSDADTGSTCGLTQAVEVSSMLIASPSGSRAALSPAMGLTPGLVPDVPGTYAIRMTATDSTGRSTFRDLSFDVGTCGTSVPAVSAVVASPSSPITGQFVSFAVTAADADADPLGCALTQPLAIASEILSSPSGSRATLSPAIGVSPGLTPDEPGTWLIRTWATDPTGLAGYRDTTLTVGVCGSRPPDAQVAVVSPISSGPARNVVAPTVVTGSLVGLDGSASTDPDLLSPCAGTGMLSHHWAFREKPAGSGATLNDANLVNPSFDADVNGNFVLLDTVTDPEGHATVATLSIAAVPNTTFATANGYSLAQVTGGTNLWNRPKGIAIDGAGAIYVIQSGNNTITKTIGTSTTLFASGGFLSGAEDIVYYASGNKFFFTSTAFNQVIQVDTGGVQTAWSRLGDLASPRSITTFVNSAGARVLLVGDDGNAQITFFNPANPAISATTGFMDFNGSLNGAWGVDAYVNGGTNIYYAGDQGNNELWRNNGTSRRLTTNVNSPRDVVRGPSGSIYEADSGTGQIVKVTDCGTPPCPTTAIASGPWEPWGLWFDGNGALLVTDRAGNALYRLTGAF